MSEEELDVELARSESGDAPELVTARAQLQGDLESLQVLFGPSAVPEVSARSRNMITIVLWRCLWNGIQSHLQVCIWVVLESSNWKEFFTDIVESLEEEADLGHIANSEVYMFTQGGGVRLRWVLVLSEAPWFGGETVCTDIEDWGKSPCLPCGRNANDSPRDRWCVPGLSGSRCHGWQHNDHSHTNTFDSRGMAAYRLSALDP